MMLEMARSVVFRETLACNACISATRWKMVLTVSVPVLQSTPGAPHLPLAPFLFHTGKGRMLWGWRERTLGPEIDPILLKGRKHEGLERKNAGPLSCHSCTGTVRA